MHAVNEGSGTQMMPLPTIMDDIRKEGTYDLQRRFKADSYPWSSYR
jgi:hypothetical protein